MKKLWEKYKADIFAVVIVAVLFTVIFYRYDAKNCGSGKIPTLDYLTKRGSN